MSNILDIRIILSNQQQEIIAAALEQFAKRNTFVGYCRKSETLKEQVAGEPYFHPAHIRELQSKLEDEATGHSYTPIAERPPVKKSSEEE